MEKTFKSKNYYKIQPISLTSNLLDIADMLQGLKQPKITQLPNENMKSLLYKGRIPFLENSFNLTAIPFIPYDLLKKLK